MKVEWISINDKKPEYSTNVLVCRPNKYSGKIDILIASLYKSKEEGTKYGRGNEMGGGYCKTYNDYWALPVVVLFETITYWMPLPKYPGEPKVEKEPIDNYLREEMDKVMGEGSFALRQKLNEIEPQKQEEVNPPIWYTKQEMYDWLKRNDYSEEIATELSEKWSTDLQGAFQKGWEKRGYEITSQSEEPQREGAVEILKPCIAFTNRHGVKCIKYEDAIDAIEYAQSLTIKVSNRVINANEPLPECLHNQYCDKQTTDMHCMSTIGCNFKG